MGGPWNSAEIIRKKRNPPSAVLIDFSRIPSQGRDTAIAMRSHRVLVSIPFIAMEARRETLAQLRTFLPDALESTWSNARDAISTAISSQLVGGRQLSVFAAYAGTPLYKKLGIKPGSKIAVFNAPKDLAQIIGETPPGAVLVKNGSRQQCDLTLWFAKSARELAARTSGMVPHAQSGGLWILWNKSTPTVGVNQLTIRKAGLSVGMVDFKIARIDQEWSGLRFTQRKTVRR